MIQDIAPHIYHNEYTPVPPVADSYLLVYEDDKVLLGGENPETEIRLPRFRDLESKIPDPYGRYFGQYIYLFTIDQDHYYLIPGLDPALLSGYTFHNVRELRAASPKHLAFGAVTGLQLYRWYNSQRYCGRCGKSMRHSRTERQMYCPSCGNQIYPILSPAVIVGVTNGDRLLLSKYEGRSFTQYAMIAGFAEIGETIEETVHREVMEEVGIRVKNLRYYKSQPWSFSGTLLFGFFCDVDGDDTLRVDHRELSMAGWFPRDQIIGQGNSASLTNEMMLLFKAGKEPG
ncbi:MAG: NAD(+) diphosphatase [Clostridiales bacterium]|nr:NAD(+) diphosphatase [Clostridiales bacterium]